MTAQAAAQPQPTQEGPPQPGSGVNVIELAEAYAKKLAGMDPAQSAAVLQRMSEQSPQLAMLVQQKLQTTPSVDMKPLPEQRPPRRDGALV